MRTRGLSWAGIVVLCVALTPGAGRAQMDTAVGYALPDPNLPIPFGPYGYQPGEGLFVHGGFALYRQTDPIEPQRVAVRGFVDLDGSIGGIPGRFIGSGDTALHTGQLGGPGTYQPGFRVGVGYRFRNGHALDLSWLHLSKAQYSAVATLVPPGLDVGPELADTFLFSPVFNFPTFFAGPVDPPGQLQLPVNFDTGVGDPGATFGIWNAADIMTISFEQRNETVELTYRVPVFETECWRTYGLVGPRFVWFWERFKWRTVDLDVEGDASRFDEAIYTNIVSNRMYGAKIGCGSEYYLGKGFSLSIDLQTALFLNIVKERVKYESGARNEGPERKRAITDYTVVPELRGTMNLWWYPYEGVQVRLGYDVMAFFNTVGSEQPIDFNYSAVAPEFDRVFRLLDGLEVGIAFHF